MANYIFNDTGDGFMCWLGYNDEELTYDANGNVLTYGNKSFTWSSSRNLESIADGENEYNYTYDENGIRTSKTVNGETTNFIQ